MSDTITFTKPETDNQLAAGRMTVAFGVENLGVTPTTILDALAFDAKENAANLDDNMNSVGWAAAQGAVYMWGAEMGIPHDDARDKAEDLKTVTMTWVDADDQSPEGGWDTEFEFHHGTKEATLDTSGDVPVFTDVVDPTVDVDG